MGGRAAIYIRVSSVGRRDRDSASYQTESEQRERCEAYAIARGLTVHSIHSDIDVSGARWDRQGLDAVLALAASRDVQAVIVYRLSRLGRGLRGILDTVGTLTEHGVALMSVNEGLDLSTAAGRLTFNLLASVDEYERELRGEYWESTKARARARGVLIGPTPAGYQRRDDSTIEPHPDHARAIAAAFRARAAGATLEEAGSIIDAVIPTRSGGSRSQNLVGRMIRNPLYRGVLPQGAGECEPLVTVEEWEAAQSPARKARRQGSYPFLLSGIARCAGCGGPMVGWSFGGVDKETPVYGCSNRSRTGDRKCREAATINAERLEPWVLGIVKPRIALAARSVADQEGEIAALDANAAAAEVELAAYVDDTNARRILGDAAWTRGLEARVADRDEKREAAAAARAEASATHGKSWDELVVDPDAMRAALRRTILSLEVRRGRGPVDDRCTIRI